MQDFWTINSMSVCSTILFSINSLSRIFQRNNRYTIKMEAFLHCFSQGDGNQYIRDEILPSYIGTIILCHYKDPLGSLLIQAFFMEECHGSAGQRWVFWHHCSPESAPTQNQAAMSGSLCIAVAWIDGIEWPVTLRMLPQKFGLLNGGGRPQNC